MSIMNSGGGYFTLEDSNTGARVKYYIPTCATPVTTPTSFLSLKNVFDNEMISFIMPNWAGNSYTTNKRIPHRNQQNMPQRAVNLLSSSPSYADIRTMLTNRNAGGLKLDYDLFYYIGDRNGAYDETSWRFYFIKKDGTRSTNYIDFELQFAKPYGNNAINNAYSSVATVLSYPYNTPITYTTVYYAYIRYKINGTGGWDNTQQLVYSAVNDNMYHIMLTQNDLNLPYALKISDSTLGAQPYVESILDNTYTHYNIKSLTAYYNIRLFNMAVASKASTWKSLYKNPDLFQETRPYAEMQTKEFENTSGAYDFTTDSIELDTLPSDSVTGSMVHCYNVDAQNLSDLHTKLFTDSFIQNLVNAVNKPMDCILKLHMLPIDVGGVNDTIVLGNLDTGISTLAKYSRFIEYNCGNISNKLEQPFGLSADYNTEYELFLPFVNMVKLNVDDVINATLNVKYRIDILTGDFVVIVTTTKYNSKGNPYTAIVYHSCGNMSADIPITSGGYNALGVVMGGIGTAASVAGLATAAATATGGLCVPAMVGGALGIAGSAVGATNSMLNQHYSFAGGIGGIGALMGHKTPFLKVTFPNVALTSGSLYNHFVGMPSMFDANIGSFSGYNAFSNFNLTFGNVTERENMRTLLNNGVYVYNGSAKPTTTSGDIVFLNNTSDDRTIGKTFTNVAVKNGSYRSTVDLLNITIDMEMTATEFDMANYVYIGDLDRFYFIKSKTILKDGLYRLNLSCDTLQTFASELKNTRALCTRSESMYDSHLMDSMLPVDNNPIVCYENFAYGFDKSDSGESVILVTI